MPVQFYAHSVYADTLDALLRIVMRLCDALRQTNIDVFSNAFSLWQCGGGGGGGGGGADLMAAAANGGGGGGQVLRPWGDGRP